MFVVKFDGDISRNALLTWVIHAFAGFNQYGDDDVIADGVSVPTLDLFDVLFLNFVSSS